jgi:hypothetical protein
MIPPLITNKAGIIVFLVLSNSVNREGWNQDNIPSVSLSTYQEPHYLVWHKQSHEAAVALLNLSLINHYGDK